MRVFISYSRKNVDVANAIVAQLRGRGADVFIDYQGMTSGNFAAQLGNEIVASDVVILLVSRYSMASRWVQAEMVWAFSKQKRIIPLFLEDADMGSLFFVAAMEGIELRNPDDEDAQAAAWQKLARLLELPAELTQPAAARLSTAETEAVAALATAPPAEPGADDLAPLLDPAAAIRDEPLPAHEDATPFSSDDLQDMFFGAVELATTDPEQAVYIYKQILDVDPDYMDGQVQDFVAREEARLEAGRLEQAAAVAETGDYQRAHDIIANVLANNPDATAAHKLAASLENTRLARRLQDFEHALERNAWDEAQPALERIQAQFPGEYNSESVQERLRTALRGALTVETYATLEPLVRVVQDNTELLQAIHSLACTARRFDDVVRLAEELNGESTYSRSLAAFKADPAAVTDWAAYARLAKALCNCELEPLKYGFEKTSVYRAYAHRLRIAIEQARRQADWPLMGSLAEELLALSKLMEGDSPTSAEEAFAAREHRYATRYVKAASANPDCDPVYAQARVATTAERWSVVNVLLGDIRERCPTYGDPAGLLAGFENIPAALDAGVAHLYPLDHKFDHDDLAAFKPTGELVVCNTRLVRSYPNPFHREATRSYDIELGGHALAVATINANWIALGTEDVFIHVAMRKQVVQLEQRQACQR